MSTAHKDPEQIKERFDEPAVLQEKAKQIAQWIKESNHFIAFTGAGVSTSAGIPDFRGPEGVWTLRAQGKAAKSRTTTLQAIPTPTHMSIVKLVEEGKLKHLISQNTDGLHRKSGLNPANLSELHGNSNIEICTKCRKEYFRDFRAVASYATSVHDHLTGRSCDKCGHMLKDTIINFKESLPQIPLETGFAQAAMADLCLAMGSSLTVSPACDMPRMVAEAGKKLVICNLQRTPLDAIATMKVYARTDDLMAIVMQELGLVIPSWKLHRRVQLKYKQVNSKGRDGEHYQLSVRGIDWEGIHASVLARVDVKLEKHKHEKTLKQEPFVVHSEEALHGEVKITLHFMGHYAEPDVTLTVFVADIGEGLIVEMDYNPYTRTWNYTIEPDNNQQAKG